MANTPATTESKLVKASARYVHIAPRKLRLVTNMVKGMNVVDALTQLHHTDKKAAPMVVKLLESAVANAKNNFSLDVERLFVKSLTADQATVMKRYFPRARGSAFTIRRKTSHINVVLEERKSGKASKSRISLFNKAKDQKPEVESVDQKIATNEKPAKDTVKKSQVFKTDEEKKMNKVANKRRLFNRKTGE